MPPGDDAAPGATARWGAFALVAIVGGLVGWWAGGLAARRLPPASPWVWMVSGIVVILALAVAWWWWRRRAVWDAAALEAIAAAPLLAHLRAPDDLTTLPSLDPGSITAAAFGHVRLAIDRQIGLPRPLLVAVAGQAAGEVPVWVGANLAIALADAGRRVLLVDARLGDRSHPPAASMPGGRGLVGVLGGVPLADAVSAGPVPGLAVLPPGARDPDEEVAELLGETFAPRLAQTASDFEVVVVLGLPLAHHVASRRMLGTGVLVLTVPERRKRAGALQDQLGRIRAAGERLVGVVLVADGAVRGR